jgi:colicin import membrane protein
MNFSKSYKVSFIIAISLHFSILIFSMLNKQSPRPVLVRDNLNTSSKKVAIDVKEQENKAIQAVTVDNKEVMKEINRLKEIKARQRQAELNKQFLLKRQAEETRRKLMAEQKRIADMKREALQLEKLKQQKILEEQKKLKEIADKKVMEEKRLAELRKNQENMRKQQALEAKKLVDIQNKHAEEIAKIERARQEKIQAELAKKAQEEARIKSEYEQAERTRIAGEVDRYKALILNAISNKWILPENANSQMSSQFQIHLAPNGAVLDVNLMRSSGDPILDRSARDAIYKASPLPVPTDPKTFNLFRDISLTVRPGNARG